MPGEVRQFDYTKQITELLGKIIDYKIEDKHIKKVDNNVVIKLNFALQDDKGLQDGVYTYKRLQKAGIASKAGLKFEFSFPNEPGSVVNLKQKMATQSFVDDMDKNFAAFDQDQDTKKAMIKLVLKDAQRALDHPSQEIDNPIVQRLVEDLDRNFEGIDETTKKIYAQKILNDAIKVTGVKLDQSPKLG